MGISASNARQSIHRVEQIMGMPIIVDVHDDDVDANILDKVYDWFREVDARFSTYKSDSEICRINRGELAVADAHGDVREVLDLCEQMRLQTHGYFDIRAPYVAHATQSSPVVSAMAIDPSGLVKGWSVDRAARLLTAAGARNFYVNAGGDIRVSGHPTGERSWRIGIQHPRERDKLAAVVELRTGAIATSGTYERGEHIVDPHTGAVPAGVLSVTVVGPDLAVADAYATAAYAMGKAGPGWTARVVGYEAMTILADDTVLYTPAFPSV
jgi:thiamine biosynthesis lipoprotein